MTCALVGKAVQPRSQNLSHPPALAITVDFTTEENGHLKVGINRLEGIWGAGETLDIALNEMMILIKSKIESLHKSYLHLQAPPKVTVTIENYLVTERASNRAVPLPSHWGEVQDPKMEYKEKRYISFIKDLDGNSHEKLELSE